MATSSNRAAAESRRRLERRYGMLIVDTHLVPMRVPLPPLMEMACDGFGPSHLMWGSDLPPVAGGEGDRHALRWTLEHTPFRSDADREWIFGQTALSLYRFHHS